MQYFVRNILEVCWRERDRRSTDPRAPEDVNGDPESIILTTSHDGRDQERSLLTIVTTVTALSSHAVVTIPCTSAVSGGGAHESSSSQKTRKRGPFWHYSGCTIGDSVSNSEGENRTTVL